jgi:transposase-like protein
LQRKKLRVAKRRVWRHPSEFRRKAVERMRKGESVLALERELGVQHGLLYKWRKQADQAELREKSPSERAYSALRQELQQTKQALAEKTLEVDFFKGALQKIEARRRQAGAGEKASTTKSGRGCPCKAG